MALSSQDSLGDEDELASCDTCFVGPYSAWNDLRVRDVEVGIERSIESWQTSAAMGCQTCATVVSGALQLLSSLYPNDKCLEITIRPHVPIADQSKAVGDYRVSLKFFRETTELKQLMILKYFTKDNFARRNPFGWGYYRPRTAGSPAAFQFVSDCLKRCETFHSCYNRSSRKVPTRLLRICSGPEPSLQLVDSASLSGELDIRYVALSYCWGGVVPIRLLKSNYTMFQSAIDWGELPLLFQETIQLIQKLTEGVRFLWIDALCIIQDSITDWEAECTQMGQVYQNAFYTIATSSAQNSNCSILSTPRSHWSEPLAVSCPQASPYSSVFVQQAPLHNIEQPLDTRLWAFQEYLMSARIIRYMSDEIHFECQGLSGCECLPAVHQEEDHGLPWNVRVLWNLLLSCNEADATRTRPLLWEEVVAEATNRELTKESDRLPALSGLASLLASTSDASNKYLAGLWTENFISGLSWETSGTAGSGWIGFDFSHASALAPSWSWASIVQGKGAGHHYGEEHKYVEASEHLEPRAQLLDSYCHVEGSNPYGQVASSFVVLKSLVKLVRLRNVPQDEDDIEFRYSIDGFPHSAGQQHFRPDAALEASPLRLAGYCTARRQIGRKSEEQQARSQPLPELWSALLVYLSQEWWDNPWGCYYLERTDTLLPDAETQPDDDTRTGSFRDPEQEGYQLRWADDVGEVTDTDINDLEVPIQQAAGAFQHLRDDESSLNSSPLRRAKFLVLGLRGSSPPDAFSSEPGEGPREIEKLSFERLGLFTVNVYNQRTLEVLLADFESMRVRIE